MKRIAVHAVPRSGSSWLGQILNSSEQVCYRFQPLFSYAFKDFLNEHSTKKEILTFFEKIKGSNDSFLLQTDKINSGAYPFFKKSDSFSHIVYKEVRYHHILENLLKQDQELKVIGLVRSPFAVISSFLNSPREFRKDLGWIEIEQWRYAEKKNLNKREEFFGYEKWKEVYFLFKKLERQYKDRFCLVNYESLIRDTLQEVERIFNFFNLEISAQTIKFLNDSKSSDNDSTYSVFRNKEKDEQWKTMLDEKIASEIREDILNSRIMEFVIEN